MIIRRIYADDLKAKIVQTLRNGAISTAKIECSTFLENLPFNSLLDRRPEIIGPKCPVAIMIVWNVISHASSLLLTAAPK